MIAKNIKAFDASLKKSIFEKLPVSLLNSIYSKPIRDLLSPKTQLDWCMILINVDIADIKDEILTTLQVWTANEVKHCSNNGIESGSYFWVNSNSEFSKQFSKYLDILLEKRLLTVDEALELVTNTFCQMQSTQQKEFVNSLPRKILCHTQAQILRKFLEPSEQVKLVWFALCKGSIDEWEKLTWQAKVLCIYRATQENIKLPQLESISEEHLLVKSVITIFRAKSNAFQLAHKLFQDYVVAEAWRSKEPLELEPLLPPCKHREVHIKYCEASPWDQHKDGNLLPYCPRLGNTQCPEQRLDPQLQLKWQDWSLNEFLTATGIEPLLPDEKISSVGQYVTKLSGWINRLNEIRKRLQCSHCQQIMVSQMPYARNLARYNATVFSCLTKTEGHDQGVYLSHCWACWGINPQEPIIDSREGAFAVKSNQTDQRTGNIKSYYLCIFCGSGPQQSSRFTQGDCCPKCGTSEMQWSQEKLVSKKSAGVMWCKACRHKIQLPRKEKITGHKDNL